MTKFQKQLTSVAAVGVMFANIVLPAFAADTQLVVSGNGADSENKVNLTVTSNNTVVQNNNANITNNVNSTASTGGNSASKNNAGDVLVKTGDASANTTVKNMVNSNTATLDCCGAGNTSVNVTGNAYGSENKAKLNLDNSNSVYQDNNANVSNNVSANAKTGDNEASKNNGGATTIVTGDAAVKNDVKTAANANSAMIGGQGGNGGSLSVIVDKNGAESDNHVYLDLSKKNNVVQDNYADVDNYIKANAKTGYNDANKNNGGDVWVQTGDAWADTNIENSVNFNWANIDCDACLTDVVAKVKDNAYDSENKIKADLTSDNAVFQGGENAGNNADLYNSIYANPSTGKNDADKNNGAGLPDDPVAIVTGDAGAKHNISNSGNVNIVGSEPSSDWPSFEMPDFNFSITLSLADLLGMIN